VSKSSFLRHDLLLKQKKHIAMVLDQFRVLEKAVIDASSIIYLEKTGCLHKLTHVLDLCAPEEIIAETGLSNLPVRLVPCRTKGRTNDELLCTLAIEMGLPVLSEDKKILCWAKERKLPYFNALMMLNFLLYKNEIDQEHHTRYRFRLTEFAWYSSGVLDFSHMVQTAILKGSKNICVPLQ
jgi:hypothetical protein